MCEELQENKKRLEDIKTRTELYTYLHSVKGTTNDTELSKVSGIQRDFLRRVIGKNDPPKISVEAKNAYALCKFIASYEGKTAKEVLEILIESDLLPQEIKPDRKIFEEDTQQEENEKSDVDIMEIEEKKQQETSGENDGSIENCDELTACIKGIIENMHFRVKEEVWKYKSELKYQTVEVEKNSILLAGIETWRFVAFVYLCTDTFDKDFEQIYEILRTHGKDKKVLFLLLCKDCHAYEKAYEKIKLLSSENSIMLISLDKSKEAYIVSMHNKHKKAFKYEKEFASYKKDVLEFAK